MAHLQVHDGTAFKEVQQPSINIGGVWTPAQKLFYKHTSGLWRQHWPPSILIKVPAGVHRNLQQLAIAAGVLADESIVFTVEAGDIVGSTSAQPALTTGDLSLYSTEIYLVINGEVQAGTGVALQATSAIATENNGAIRGHGGDGGHGGIGNSIVVKPVPSWPNSGAQYSRNPPLVLSGFSINVPIASGAAYTISRGGITVRGNLGTVSGTSPWKSSTSHPGFLVAVDKGRGQNIRYNNAPVTLAGGVGGVGGVGQRYGVTKTVGIVGALGSTKYNGTSGDGGAGGDGGDWGTAGGNGVNGGGAGTAGRTDGAVAGNAISGIANVTLTGAGIVDGTNV